MSKGLTAAFGQNLIRWDFAIQNVPVSRSICFLHLWWQLPKKRTWFGQEWEDLAHHTSSSCSIIQNRLIWSQFTGIIDTRPLLEELALLRLLRCISNKELSVYLSFISGVQIQNPAPRDIMWISNTPWKKLGQLISKWITYMQRCFHLQQV